MRKIRVKYIYSEEELNKFLDKIDVNLIHNISYLPTSNGVLANDAGSIITQIIAIVQYWEVQE